MCGIVGYLGSRDVVEVLVSGLSKLEYRGYDSSGITVLENEQLRTVKAKGKLKNLVEKLKDEPLDSHLGIGHTRWAT
ncbi:MAG: glutamine--fructose-6-phosphate aminotransferase, partial [Clostridiaceae bacterium]